jgi:hypothetical protein
MESCNLSLLSANYHHKFYNLENKSVLYFQPDFQILVNHKSFIFFPVISSDSSSWNECDNNVLLLFFTSEDIYLI